jgi:YD repeat-containing protein
VYLGDEIGSFPQPIATFAYDARGRWTQTTLAGGSDITTARYEARLMETRNGSFVETVTRDAAGRILTVTRDGQALAIAWRGDDVVGVGDTVIERDAQHRIAKVGTIVVERDASGRAVKATGAGTRSFVYDASGALARRVDADASLEIVRQGGRVTELIEHHAAGDNGHMLLNYACE